MEGEIDLGTPEPKALVEAQEDYTKDIQNIYHRCIHEDPNVEHLGGGKALFCIRLWKAHAAAQFGLMHTLGDSTLGG